MANFILKLNLNIFWTPSMQIAKIWNRNSLPGENLQRRRAEKEKCCFDTKNRRRPDLLPIRYRRGPESCRRNSGRGSGPADRGRLRLGEQRPDRRAERSAEAPDSSSGWAGTRKSIERFLCADPLDVKTKQKQKQLNFKIEWLTRRRHSLDQTHFKHSAQHFCTQGQGCFSVRPSVHLSFWFVLFKPFKSFKDIIMFLQTAVNKMGWLFLHSPHY